MRIAAVIFAFTVAMPWPTGQPSAAHTSTAPVSIYATSPEWEAQVEWGLDRFQEAGLELPPMVVTIHEEAAGCNGETGLFRATEPAQVHLCSNQVPQSRVARLITLHELAHAWAETALSDDARSQFLEVRHLDGWIDERLPRHEWGAEHAAEVVSWGLMDEQTPIVRVNDTMPSQLIEAWDVLVEAPPLWQDAKR